MTVEQIVIDSHWHQQTAIDRLVLTGESYRDASEAVDAVFEKYSMHSEGEEGAA